MKQKFTNLYGVMCNASLCVMQNWKWICTECVQVETQVLDGYFSEIVLDSKIQQSSDDTNITKTNIDSTTLA